MSALPTSSIVEHRPTTVCELGHGRRVCAECSTPWPCHAAVMERCARLDIANGLGCACGWHEENVAQDPEQGKVRWTA